MTTGYGPIANQRTCCTTQIKLADGKTKTLQPGSYVKAIRKSYLPKGHPLEDYDDEIEVAVFSQYGIGLVPYYSLDWNVY